MKTQQKNMVWQKSLALFLALAMLCPSWAFQVSAEEDTSTKNFDLNYDSKDSDKTYKTTINLDPNGGTWTTEPSLNLTVTETNTEVEDEDEEDTPGTSEPEVEVPGEGEGGETSPEPSEPEDDDDDDKEETDTENQEDETNTDTPEPLEPEVPEETECSCDAECETCEDDCTCSASELEPTSISADTLSSTISYTLNSYSITGLPTSGLTKEGYVFAGWSTTAGSVSSGTFTPSTKTSVASSITFTAQWTSTASEYSIYTYPTLKYATGEKLDMSDLELLVTSYTGTKSYIKYSTSSDSFDFSISLSTQLTAEDDSVTITYTDENKEEHAFKLNLSVGANDWYVYGTITDDDGEPVESATVALYQQNVKKYSGTSDEDGEYSIQNVDEGRYELLITTGSHELTYEIHVEEGDSVKQNVVLTPYVIQTVSYFGSTDVSSVGGLVELANYYAASSDQQVEIIFTATSDVDTADRDYLEYYKDSNEYLALVLDATVDMEVTDSDGDSSSTNLTTLGKTITFTFEIPEDFRDRSYSSYKVYRKHGDLVSSLTTSSSTEFITVDHDQNTITVTTKYFSAYALAVTLDEDDEVDEYEGYTKPLTLIKVVNNVETTSSLLGGSAHVSSTAPVLGQRVVVYGDPIDGYTLTDVLVVDSSGEKIATTRNSDDTYHFIQGELPVEVTVKFLGNSISTMPAGYNRFVDVKDDIYYTYAANRVTELTLMSATSGFFYPDQVCSRGMLVVTLYAMAGRPEVTTSNSFSDVNEYDWYYTATQWGKETGVVAGYEDGTYRPDLAINREQLALIMYNYAKFSPDIRSSTSLATPYPYDDYDSISYWAETAVNWCTNHGLFAGSYGKFDPSGDTIRCNLAITLLKLYELY